MVITHTAEYAFEEKKELISEMEVFSTQYMNLHERTDKLLIINSKDGKCIIGRCKSI
jgi:hypothetical protein